MISYREALNRTLAGVAQISSEAVALLDLERRVLAQDIRAGLDSPSVDSSLKDGYAVRSADIHSASTTQPVRLRLVGLAAAGAGWEGELLAGTAVRILTGAPIPSGATAVLAEEFSRTEGDQVWAMADAEPGRNIMALGSDVHAGQLLARKGEVLSPETIGLLAAAGYGRVPVVRRVSVGILATGDEVVAPGSSLGEGQLYASNLVALGAWCIHYGMEISTAISQDSVDEIRGAIESLLQEHDAVLTSGGAWKGDRDLIIRVLDDMAWNKSYHRVRMGPGKAAGFGTIAGKAVFCLPGGPPSNQMAFLQLALPGLLKMGGHHEHHLPTLPVRLRTELHGQTEWTQFIYGSLSVNDERLEFEALSTVSRLQMMAHAEAIVAIPEGLDHLPAGSAQLAQILITPHFAPESVSSMEEGGP